MLSYYTAIIGKGSDESKVSISSTNNSNIQSYNENYLNSPDNVFWRTLENITLASTIKVLWNSGQESPLRFVNIESTDAEALVLDQPAFTAGCGGFISDCSIAGTIKDSKGQQYCFKNTHILNTNTSRSGQYNYVYYNSPVAPNSSDFSQNTALKNKSTDNNGQTVIISSTDYESFKKSSSYDYAKPLYRDLYNDSNLYIIHDINNITWTEDYTYFLPANTYLLDKEINIDVSNITLLGIGYPIIKCMTSNMNGIVVNGNNCKLASFIIDAPPKGSNSSDNCIIKSEGVSNEFYDITLRTLGITDFTSGVEVNTMFYINNSDNYVENCWCWRGDHFGDSSEGVYIGGGGHGHTQNTQMVIIYQIMDL